MLLYNEREFLMLKAKFAVGTVAFVLSAFSFGLLGSTANAITPVGTGLAITEPSNIHLAYVKRKVVKRHGNGHRHGHTYGYRHGHNYGYRHGHRAWVYSSRYGHRYRARRAGYAYYYGGWWYPRPYWQPGISICIGC
jgi:hypothetical protein